MNVSLHQFKTRLSHYLHLAWKGETVPAISRDTPAARLEPVIEAVERIPEIPLVTWATGHPKRTQSARDIPKIEGESLADWIIGNRG